MANKKVLFTVYETDAWHSTASKEFKGIFTSKTTAVNAIVKYHRIDDHELFENIHQMIPPNKEGARSRSKTATA